MVSSPQSQVPPHQYPEAIRLKLYQAFIFSIPVLFSIILFLLFYLFYLKRRASGNSSAAPVLPRTVNDANITAAFDLDLKNKLYTVLFDEQVKPSDSLCCVCLGEFEMKEELLQVPSCKHVFHVDCIRHWLRSNSTCPLCRGSVVPDGKSGPHCHHPAPNLMPGNGEPDYHQVLVPPLSQHSSVA